MLSIFCCQSYCRIEQSHLIVIKDCEKSKIKCVKAAFRSATYEKETPTQVFFCKYCKIFKNSSFCRIDPVAASECGENSG